MSEDKSVRFTTILRKYPTYRDDSINWCWKWLAGRRKDDNAEGLWRVHDKLYDLKSFINQHPGGRDWLTVTKGMDITEAFESYHITPKASLVLSKYYVRDAKDPRNYKFTYEEEGFYRTLKRRVAQKLESVSRDDIWKSKLYLDIVVLSLFLSSIIAVRMDHYLIRGIMILIAAQCAAWINTLSHNFIHQRSNLRMYSANIVLVGWRDWRVFHGLSHHLYPNSYADLEVKSYEPFLLWIPIQKRTRRRVILSYVLTPFTYLFLFHSVLVFRIVGMVYSRRQKFRLDELIALLLPLSMLVFGNLSLSFRNIMFIGIVWNVILLLASFMYSVVAVNAGHHVSAETVHEGDEFKSLDYGIYQLAATIDRFEAKANLFVSLTHFGDHMLHHFFPSLDHSILPHLRETLIETCKDFESEFRECSMLHALVGQFKQLSRTTTIKLKPKTL